MVHLYLPVTVTNGKIASCQTKSAILKRNVYLRWKKFNCQIKHQTWQNSVPFAGNALLLISSLSFYHWIWFYTFDPKSYPYPETLTADAGLFHSARPTVFPHILTEVAEQTVSASAGLALLTADTATPYQASILPFTLHLRLVAFRSREVRRVVTNLHLGLLK